MDQRNCNYFTIKTKNKIWPDIECYALTANVNLYISSEYDYIYYDHHDRKHAIGMFPEEHDREKIPINKKFAYWFSPMNEAGTKILYYSAQHDCLKTYDFFPENPANQCENWSEKLNVDRNTLHSFIWLHYCQSEDYAQLLTTVPNASDDKQPTENDNNNTQANIKLVETKIKLEVIRKNEAPTPIKTTADNVMRVNMMVKYEDRLCFATNEKGKTIDIYSASLKGLFKWSFEADTEVVFVDFFFHKENTIMLLYNEGENAKTGIFRIQLNMVSSNIDNDLTLKAADTNSVAKINLENKEEKDGSVQLDSYVTYDNMSNTICTAMADNTLCNWKLRTVNAKWEAEMKKLKHEEISKYCVLCTATTLDKSTMISCEMDDDYPNTRLIHNVITKGEDMKCIYSWLIGKTCTDEGGKMVWKTEQIKQIKKFLMIKREWN